MNEDKLLAEYYLENTFYEPYRKGKKQLEIFLTSACNANCKYCYLKKHQHELYPSNITNEIIISNLKKTLKWYVSNKFRCKIDIFSGNWITTPLGPQVFEVLYDTFKNVKPSFRPSVISFPDNMQFLKNEKATLMVEENITRFAELGIKIWISASIDGYFCDIDRTENDDEFYAKLIYFLNKYKYLPHPMISSTNVKQQISNYQWWRNNFNTDIVKDLMTLEVRDNSWTEENIADLVQYCDFLVDYKFKNDFNNDKMELLKYVLNLYPRLKEKEQCPPYNMIGLNIFANFAQNDSIGCSNNNRCLHIRMGDLKVGLCHRLFYPEFILGQYESNEDSITEFTPENVALLIGYKELRTGCMPYCEKCLYFGVCPKQCYGASYEDLGNPMVPDLEVCKMYQSKISFLVYKYYTMDLFNKNNMKYLKEILQQHEYKYLQVLISSILNNMGINWED